MRRDKDLVDKMVDELLRSPDVPTEAGPAVQTKSVFKTWWFWTLLGAVVAGSATAYVLASKTTPTPPKYSPGQGGLLIQF